MQVDCGALYSQKVESLILEFWAKNGVVKKISQEKISFLARLAVEWISIANKLGVQENRVLISIKINRLMKLRPKGLRKNVAIFEQT